MLTHSNPYVAFLPLLSLCGWLFMFALKRRSLFIGDCMGLLYHLALLPVVQLLPGGIELKFAGYLWLFCDAMIDMASINGAGHDAIWKARMAVHLPAAIWITGASAGMSGGAFYIGMLLGPGLLLHAVFGPRIRNTKQVLGVFVIPTMAAWLGCVAYWL